MIERDQLTLDYLNNIQRLKLLRGKYDEDIITGKETIELINLYRENKKIRKKINKILDRG